MVAFLGELSGKVDSLRHQIRPVQHRSAFASRTTIDGGVTMTGAPIQFRWDGSDDTRFAILVSQGR